MIADRLVEATDLIPVSADTACNWIISEFKKQKAMLMEKFSMSRSRVHLYFDLWTAPAGNQSYLSVVASWVDENYEIRT